MAYPTLAPNNTWYKGSAAKNTITKINIVDSYTPSGSEKESWNADADNSGSIKCYITGTVLTIAGNGSGRIAMNADSSEIFRGFTKTTTIDGTGILDASKATTLQRAFYDCTSVESLDLSNWDTSSVTSLYSAFNGMLSLKSLNVASWDTSAVTSMYATFQCCSALTELDLTNWSVDSVSTTRIMFCGLPSYGDEMALTKIIGIENWNMEKVEDAKSMFELCTSLASLDLSGWRMPACKSMASMFYKCGSLASIGDTSNWDTSSCTDMQKMFCGCTSLTELDVSKWDVSKVTTFESMFSCASDYGQTPMIVTELDVSNWDTSSCTDMSFMFYGCRGPKEIDVSGWDVSQVTTFDHMFAHSYLAIGDISDWKNTIVENLECAFHSTRNTVLDVSGFRTGNCLSFGGMFKQYGSSLVNIIGLENFDTSDSFDFGDMFYGCSEIEELNLSSFDTRKAKDGVATSANGTTSNTLGNMFYGMTKLRKITLGEKFSINGDGTTTANFAVLPTPSSDYIDGATGKWYRTSDWQEFAPENVPSMEAMTYVAVHPAVFVVEYTTMRNIADAIREKTGRTDGIDPDDMGRLIRGINTGG